jgi:Transglutaminase-like superfamily
MSSLARKLRRLRSLTPDERRLLAQAWLRLHAVDFALRAVPLDRLDRRLLRRATRARSAAPPPADPVALAARLAELVEIAARHGLVPLRCLPRALVLRSLLASRGVESRLRFGARRTASGLEAHAWLEGPAGPLAQPGDIASVYPPLDALASVQGTGSV